MRPGDVSAWRRPHTCSLPSAHSPCTLQLAELIRSPPGLVTLISAKEEPKQKAPKEKKPHPWAPPPQHNFLKNWQRHIALRKKQQEALSGEPSGQGSRRASATTEAPLPCFSVPPPGPSLDSGWSHCANHSKCVLLLVGPEIGPAMGLTRLMLGPLF